MAKTTTQKTTTTKKSGPIRTASIALELPPIDDQLFKAVLASQKASGKDVVRGSEKPKGSSKSKGKGDLSFDPVAAELGWEVLKFVGEVGIAFAGAVVGELIYKVAEKRKEKARKTVRVRFPDGTLYNLVVDNPQSMAELERLIAEKATQA